jgi:ubiquitin C-terminal hydrolase
MRDEENNISIEYPVTGLDLSKYSYHNSHKYVYDLYAVCNHVGGMSYGHYYVYIKNSENKWILFNDDSVSVIDDIENCFLLTHTVSLQNSGDDDDLE